MIGESEIEGSVSVREWNKLTATIKATGTDNAGQLVLLTGNNGRLYIDMVSLFPYTWRNRPNGLRPDLAQLLADTRPTFLRFREDAMWRVKALTTMLSNGKRQ